MNLTNCDITQIIHTGIVDHSPLAVEFINEVKQRYDLEIVACYLDTSQILYFDNELIPSHKTDLENTQLVNSLCLTLYVRDLRHDDIDSFKKEYGDILLKLFKNIVKADNESIEFVRTFSPEEMRYYGWLNKKIDDWDRTKIIYPKSPIVERDVLLVHSFDQLALWHILNEVKKCGENIYCGWDENNNTPNLFIILPEKHFDLFNENYKKALVNKLLNHMHSLDKYNVVKDESFNPIFTTWDSLTEEKKFSLLRDR